MIGTGTLGLLTHRRAAARPTRRSRSSPPPSTRSSATLARELGADVVVAPERARPRSCGRAPARCGSTTASSPAASRPSSTASARPSRSPRRCGSSRPAARSTPSACPASPRSTSRRCGSARSPCAGAYAYERADFDTAIELVRDLDLGRLVSATYPLRRYEDAIAHAAIAGARGAVKIAFDLRVGTREGHHLMPRPGFVLEVDRSTPPILFHHGEGFRLEKLPAGRSRVLYPAEPLDAARRPRRRHPPRPRQPARRLARRCGRCCSPGMKLTIAFDDISLPLPPMRRPDVRQRVIEAVLDLAAAAGVDDVHLIAALALHRRMTEAELRHAVGDRVYDAFAPHGLLYNHDAEDPDNMAFLGTTDQGEEVEINKRAAESDLIVYVNINLVSMDGGWKSTATGLASLPRRCATTTTCETMQQSRSFMDRHKQRAPLEQLAHGRGAPATAGVKVFQIETTLNNDTFGTVGPDVGAAEARVGVDGARPGHVHRHEGRPRPHADEGPPQDLPLAGRRPTASPRCRPARSRPCTRSPPQNVFEQQLVPIEGQTDILTMGLPYICPYNVQLDHEPDPRDVPRARLLLQHVPGPAARARGRRAHHEPPHAVGVPPRPPPELHRLLRAGAGRHHRPARDRGHATRSSSPRTSGTATSTARATPTTASTRSTCGTGAATRCSTSAR